MPADSSLSIALLTPPGRGALAVVGVDGAAALEAVARLFHPRGTVPLAERPDGAIAFGRWGDPERGEELVVVRHTADRLEVHCHGGVAASEAVIASLESQGAVRQPWPDWLAAAGASATEAEAREALARAGGTKAAQILCWQLAGAIDAELARIAALDAAGDEASATAARDRLRRAARVGLRLTRPWRVVVFGEVNAGKSSLVNALAGHARSIVSAEPGTTRDVLETRIVLDGWEIDLVDTAGLRGAGLADASPTERAGIERAITATAEADLVLQVVDCVAAGRAGGPPDRTPEACATGGDVNDHVGHASGVPYREPPARGRINSPLLVLSKCDLAPAGFVPHSYAFPTSTVTGEGIKELAAAIIHRLVPEEHDDPGLLAGPVPFTERQVELLASRGARLRRAVP